MGTFLTNVQLYVGDKNPKDIYPLVRDALIVNLSDTYELVDSDDLASRTVLVAPSSTKWVSIYDQDSELQEVRILRQLARSISKRMKLQAFSVMVHDSDVLWMDLFSSGKKIDSYCSNVGFLQDDGKGLPVKQELGNPDKWQTLMGSNKSSQDLKRAWTAEFTFAEEMLDELAVLLDIDGNNLRVGYNILDGMKQLPPNMEKLYFRSRRPVPLKPADFEFKSLGVDLVRSVSPGKNIIFSVMVQNKGASGKGIGIRILGDFKEVLHVKPNRCWVGKRDTLLEGPDLPDGQSEFISTQFEELPAWSAEFPEFRFDANPKNVEDKMVSIAVEFSAHSVGEDDFIIAAFPLENPDHGYSQLNVGVRVRLSDAY